MARKIPDSEKRRREKEDLVSLSEILDTVVYVQVSDVIF